MSDQIESKKHKRGDTREDGWMFWCYQRGRENWVSPENFERRKQKARDESRKTQKEAKQKRSEYLKLWREKNRDKYAAYQKAWREANPGKSASYTRKWKDKKRDEHRERKKRWRKANPEKAYACKKRWREKNREHFRKQKNAYEKLRASTDAMYLLARRLRKRVYAAFKRVTSEHKPSLLSLLGCTIEEAKAHLESLFQPGMSWENRSEWHIDHIVPLASATSSDEMVSLCHYTNLQPLWAKDNIRKGAKMPANLQETRL